jgi:uncharacterized protein DUF1902
MTTRMVVVRAKYDDNAKVWYVEHSDLFGVHAEGTTFDDLCGKLQMSCGKGSKPTAEASPGTF